MRRIGAQPHLPSMGRIRLNGIPPTRFPIITLWSAVLAAVAFFSTSCAALPAVRGYYTPEELYRNAAALVGQTVAVRGKVEIVAGICTEIACPPDNPCCNSCNYSLGFKIDEFQRIYFSGKAAGCTGDDCHAECMDLKEGGWYEITGRLWKDFGVLYYLELKDWKRIE